MKLPEKKSDRIGILLASALGLGLSPILPGTCGALLGVFLHVLIVSLFPAKMHLGMLTFTFIAIGTASHVLTPLAESHWGCKDPGQFVLDEVAGYLFVFILFREPVELWKAVVWGFVLFRIFDIFKLMPPARLIDQQLHGPWGILLDDLVSAAYAAFFLYLVYWFGPVSLLGKG